jgi:hypothetical protein
VLGGCEALGVLLEPFETEELGADRAFGGLEVDQNAAFP